VDSLSGSTRCFFWASIPLQRENQSHDLFDEFPVSDGLVHQRIRKDSSLRVRFRHMRKLLPTLLISKPVPYGFAPRFTPPPSLFLHPHM